MLVLLLCAVAFDAMAPAAGAQTSFGFSNVAEQARALARKAFTPPTTIPELWQKVGYDQYRDIDFDRNQSLWREAGNFRVELLHPGSLYKHPVTINTYDRTGV